MPTDFCNGLNNAPHEGDSPGAHTGLAAFQLHPLFGEIHGEVHARPFPVASSPLVVAHFVFLRGDEKGARDVETTHLKKLWEVTGAGEMPAPHRGWEMPFRSGARELILRVERHTEFTTYAFWSEGPFEDPFEPFPWPADLQAWLGGVPGKLISAIHLALQGERKGVDREAIRRHFEGARLIATTVVEESATVWTSYKLLADGYLRFLIHSHDLHVCRAGRLVQRLLEMETYRALAMMGLPQARQVWPKLTEIELELVRVFDALNSRGEVDQAAQHQLLAQLTRLADEVEHLRADTSYRFAATQAYGTLVHELLGQLGEEQIPGMQTLGEFLDRRLPAALRTCESASRRLESLSERVDRAAQLLRTRIDLTLEMQNQDLLSSMHERAGVQLRLQQAVEGLSVAAVAYYSLGLVSHLAKGISELGLHLNPEIAAVTAFPFIVFALWRNKIRLHKLVEGAHEN